MGKLKTKYTIDGKEVSIKGITFSNMYWDSVHRSTGEVSKHFQTYDYDDLYKIYREVRTNVGGTSMGRAPDNVVCSFKYRKAYNNDEPSTISDTNKYKNGWEYLTDYFGNIVDVFGNKIEKSEGVYYTVSDIVDGTLSGYTGETVRIISQDYRHNCAGKYATEWAIYDKNNSKITTIVPSALIIRPEAKTVAAIDAAFDKYDSQTKAYKDNYIKLKGLTRAAATDVTGQPALITWEKSIWGGADQADRCDARWYYSYESDGYINAKIKVQYSEDNGKTWKDAPSAAATGLSTEIGATALFTADEKNASTNVIETANVTVDKSSNFSFKASDAAATQTEYSFYGWAVERDGVIQEFSTKSTTGSQTEGYWVQTAPKSSSATFIARYIKKPTTGEFTIYHDPHQQSTGKGNVQLTVTSVDTASATTGTQIGTVTSDDYEKGVSIKVDSTYIKSSGGKFLRAEFESVTRGDSALDDPFAYATASQDLTAENAAAYASKFDYIESITVDKAKG